MRQSVVLCLIMFCAAFGASNALADSRPAIADSRPAIADPSAAVPDSLEHLISRILDWNGVEVSGEWFIAYENGLEDDRRFSTFYINRGYINVKKRLLPWLSGRITPDISVDREGDGEGDLELRLKYCYVRADLPGWLVFTQPAIEFGMIERPWLGFEQKVNRYRVQGNMFLEREDILNSADFGAAIEGNFGGRMDREYRNNVNSSWDGRYGSYSIGIFNGGGYHAIEQNHNKSIETRLTLRPLPGVIPGLQFTYAGTFSKGNTVQSPESRMDVGYVTYEHRAFVLAGTYFTGKGNQGGDAIDEFGVAIPQAGYSTFGELRLGILPLNVFGRYDSFTADPDADASASTDRIIAGAAWRLDARSMLVADYEVNRGVNAETLRSVFKFSVLYRF